LNYEQRELKRNNQLEEKKKEEEKKEDEKNDLMVKKELDKCLFEISKIYNDKNIIEKRSRTYPNLNLNLRILFKLKMLIKECREIKLDDKNKEKNLTSYINNLETMIFFNKNFVINPKNYNKILKNFFL